MLNAAPEASCEKSVFVALTAKFSSPFSSSPCNKHNRNGTATQTPEKLGKKGEETPFGTLLHPSSPFEINTTVTQPQPQKSEKGEEKKVKNRPFSCYTCMLREGKA